MTRPVVSVIAAVAANGVIGRGNTMAFRLPEDQRYFAATTRGAPVVMGRSTWDSLPARFRPLPDRRNIVITRQAGWQAEGAEAVPSLEAALALAGQVPRVFVIGGEQVYRLALPVADELLLTEIEREFEGDTHFPAWPRQDFVEVTRERHHAAPPNDFDFAFVTYRRR